MNPVYHRPRMTRISWNFTYPCVSVSSVQSVFHCTPSAFIMPKPCGFSTPRTRMPAGIRGHALQRRDSGRHHLRLIFVSLSDRIQEMSLSGLDIGCQKNIGSACDYQTHSCLNLLENKPQINADERRFVNLNIQRLSEVYEKKINNELVRTPYELTLLEFVSVRFSSLFFSGSFMKMGVDATQ